MSEEKMETCLHCGKGREEHLSYSRHCRDPITSWTPDDRHALRERITELEWQVANWEHKEADCAMCCWKNEKKADALLDVVKRIRGWDHLDGAGDGPFWKRELDAAIALAAALAGEKPIDPAWPLTQGATLHTDKPAPEPVADEADGGDDGDERCSACKNWIVLDDGAEWPEDRSTMLCNSCAQEEVYRLRAALAGEKPIDPAWPLTQGATLHTDKPAPEPAENPRERNPGSPSPTRKADSWG